MSRCMLQYLQPAPLLSVLKRSMPANSLMASFIGYYDYFCMHAYPTYKFMHFTGMFAVSDTVAAIILTDI